MEINTNINKILPKTETDNLIPKLNSFDDHFVLADKLGFLSLDDPHLKFLNEIEKSWKEIENFEFQKMDIEASFKQIIRNI